MLNENPISPEKAGGIAQKLLEYQARNPLRELVDDLLAMGVSKDDFISFTALHRSASLDIPESLVIEIWNMLQRLNKGLVSATDQRSRMTPVQIRAHVKRVEQAAAEQVIAADERGRNIEQLAVARQRRKA